MQHCDYKVKFCNVCEVKKRLVQPGLVWSRILSILLLMKCLLACVRIVVHHFKPFYYSQLKNVQLDELLAKVSEI